ncbi:hypothetical protein J31TS4_27020 [Paenibacillus sp. J31TS4]|uniref:GNAT family N-acetyltransferase n=1 Tax=Paenibacillus sp. J31TS4 TaxID=2807195 RepID=UPI001B118EF2|nr:N-acetyltransferase [Paenibacillus sp. J31TS4]GIP39422.1 hypothetical protein J31TS4_27020 [Paenibacillus sp. J31TS4]
MKRGAANHEAEFDLGGGFKLFKADSHEFGIYSCTYRENIFFRQSWERRVAVFDPNTPYYWICLDGKRVGGVSISPNTIWNLFLLPPFADWSRLVGRLRALLVTLSNPLEPISAHGILPDQIPAFHRAGFVTGETRRVMIRPTGSLGGTESLQPFSLAIPTLEHVGDIASAACRAYAGPDGLGYPGLNTREQHETDTTAYFEHNTQEVLRQASCLAYDGASGELAGFCLISLWEGLPLVSNLAVLPAYRGQGLASAMLLRALSVLRGDYELLRLFVTIGNGAEQLYHNLGFHAGTPQAQVDYQMRGGDV